MNHVLSHQSNHILQIASQKEREKKRLEILLTFAINESLEVLGQLLKRKEGMSSTTLHIKVSEVEVHGKDRACA